MTAAHLDPDAPGAIPVGMYTETLARLYFRQGYTGEALRIYRHLAAERPHDLHLQDQIRVLTQQLAAVPAVEPRPAGRRDQPPRPEPSAGASRLEPVIAELERWLTRLQRDRTCR